MKEILLHIGRHKSGTSSIQQFLYKNSQFIRENGFFYPINSVKKGYGHHTYAESLQRSNFRQRPWKSEIKHLKEYFSELFDELSDEKINIISSEAFQNCDPELVKEIFSDYKVTVVCYIRNEIEYLASAYSQRVHATNYHHDVYAFEKSFKPNYIEFISSWKACFDNFKLSIFDRSHLLRSDVVTDFCVKMLGIDELLLNKVILSDEANPSLGIKLVSFKLELNQQGRFEQNKLLYKELGQMASDLDDEKFKLPCDLLKKLRQRYEKTEKELRDCFFNGEKVFNYDSISCTEKSNKLSDNEFDHLLKYLEQRLKNEC